MNRRTTMRDVAKAAGVTQAAVSYALRNHPSISLATRQTIHAIAQKLGYRPDPMLSAMSVYRQSIKLPKYRGTLAWLENHPTRDGCRKIQAFKDFFLGASERAQELGYTLEIFWLREPGLTHQRLSKILLARNILGLLIAPQPRGRAYLRLEWERFSVTAMGHSLVQPQFHVVIGNQYLAVVKTMRHLYALGYRRIGFVSTKFHSESAAHNQLAAFLVEQRRFKSKNPVPVLIVEKGGFSAKSEFLSWYKRYVPQAIVTTIPEVSDMLKKIGERIPKDVGLALPNMPCCFESFSGINMNTYGIGRVATDFLVSLIHRNEKGIPKAAQRILVDGAWVEGKTVGRINITRKSPKKLTSS